MTAVLTAPPTSPQAKQQTTPSGATPAGTKTDDGGQCSHAAQRVDAPVVASPDRPASAVTPPKARSLADPTLALAADVLDDLETVRIANENRLRQLTRSGEDADGEERGFGLDESHPDVAKLSALVQMLADAEHQGVLNLNRTLRRHPLGPWVKGQKGVGEKTAARLLAVIGDPYINSQTGQPRTVSQLWSYCGHGDPSRTKFKGMSQDDLFRLGSPLAKKRVWLIATAILKAGGGEERAKGGADSISRSPSLAATYYLRKSATEGREHAAECKRCGPSGSPALPGSPWSDAHRHADALRIVGKEFLRQLWLESKRIHEEQ